MPSLFSDDTAKSAYDHEGLSGVLLLSQSRKRGNTYAVINAVRLMSVAEIAAADRPDDCRGDGMWLYQTVKRSQRVYSPEELRKRRRPKSSPPSLSAESAIAPLARAVKPKIRHR